jgi:hypothetical protein
MQNTPPTKRASNSLQNQAVKNQPEWADEKFITRNFGLGHTSLYNLRLAGKIRTTSTRAEGMNRGKRLFHVQSVRDFLEAQEIAENSNKEGAR